MNSQKKKSKIAMAMNSYQIKADEKKAANIVGLEETFVLE